MRPRCPGAVVCLLMALPGCAIFSDRGGRLPLVPPDAASPEYTVSPGDHLRVRYPWAPQLDDEALVRPDGRVVLPAVGEVRAAGRTVEQLTLDLIVASAPLVTTPDVSVQVMDPRGTLVSVGGEVLEPQRLAVAQAATVGEALHAAGGILFSGDESRVVLLRHVPGQPPRAWRVRLSTDDAGLGAQVPLWPNDVIFVPKTRKARAVLAFEQYVLELLPIKTRFDVLWAINETGATPEEAATAFTR